MGVAKEFSAASWADKMIAVAEGKSTIVVGIEGNHRTVPTNATLDPTFDAVKWANELIACATALKDDKALLDPKFNAVHWANELIALAKAQKDEE